MFYGAEAIRVKDFDLDSGLPKKDPEETQQELAPAMLVDESSQVARPDPCAKWCDQSELQGSLCLRCQEKNQGKSSRSLLPANDDCWDMCVGQAGPCLECGDDGFCMKNGTFYDAGQDVDRSRSSDSNPVAFKVTGAGDTNVNGVWKQTGWRKGHPYYKKKNLSRFQMYWSVSRQAWRLFDDGWFRNKDLYWSKNPTPTASTTGWEVKNAPGPVPNITILNAGIYEKRRGKKPAQGGDYRCVTIAP